MLLFFNNFAMNEKYLDFKWVFHSKGNENRGGVLAFFLKMMTNGVVSISIVFVCSRSQSHHANTASTPATKVCDHYKTAYLSIEWRIRCLWCNCYHEIIIKKSKNSSKLLLWMPLLLINEYFCAYFVLFHHYMLIQQVLELFFEGNAITMDILKSATDSLTLPCTGSFLKRFFHLIVSTKMAANNER